MRSKKENIYPKSYYDELDSIDSSSKKDYEIIEKIISFSKKMILKLF